MYREHQPPARLSPWVECAWTLEPTEDVIAHRVPPDGCLDIIYSEVGGLVAVGAMTRQREFSLAAGVRSIGLRFRPGMAGAFLRAAPGELTDRTVPMEDLWGARAREIGERVYAGPSRAAVEVLFAALQPPDSPGPVQRAISAMTAMRGIAGIARLADQANLSERQFRRRCEEESGMPPKLLARILRFRTACALAARAGERVDWAAVAAEAGYFDQAHFIRDFREFTGETPMSVFSNTRTGGRG